MTVQHGTTRAQVRACRQANGHACSDCAQVEADYGRAAYIRRGLTARTGEPDRGSPKAQARSSPGP